MTIIRNYSQEVSQLFRDGGFASLFHQDGTGLSLAKSPVESFGQIAALLIFPLIFVFILILVLILIAIVPIIAIVAVVVPVVAIVSGV